MEKSQKQKTNAGSAGSDAINTCGKCGAIREDQQQGLEDVLDCLGWATGQRCGGCYICRMTEVLREVRRVLRDDGTCWVNIGSSYNSSPAGNKAAAKDTDGAYQRRQKQNHQGIDPDDPEFNVAQALVKAPQQAGLKSKDQLCVPWRLGLSLQADGWVLRQDVIWAKGLSHCPTWAGSVMPESCRDRFTSSHEYILVLAKKERYFWDKFAIRESGAYPAGTKGGKGSAARNGAEGVNSRPEEYAEYSGYRNPRSVWAISGGSAGGAKAGHYASYREQLCETPIKAGTSEYGVCAKCGTPWRRVTEDTPMQVRRSHRAATLGGVCCSGTMTAPAMSVTTGWEPTCGCGCADRVPATVLDPYSGTGTTGVVAAKLGRSYIGIELSPDYAQASRVRLGLDYPREGLFEEGEEDE